MVSKYEESLRALAIESDEDKRLELASNIAKDIVELDELYELRANYDDVVSERDDLISERDLLIAERDELKQKYIDRFFDSENVAKKEEPESEDKGTTLDTLWD